jgi:hypothetical protein
MKRLAVIAACFAVLFASAGCVKSPSSSGTRDTPAPQAKPEDGKAAKKTPLERFKQFVAKMEENRRNIEEGGTFSFDVQQTSSLVSPLTGVLEIRWTRSGGDKWLVRCNYAFQDDRWVYKNGTMEITNLNQLTEGAQEALVQILAIHRDSLFKPDSLAMDMLKSSVQY